MGAGTQAQRAGQSSALEVQRAPETPASGAADQLRGQARQSSYADGAQQLRPTGPAASLSQQMPEGVDLRSLSAWFTLPQGTVLASDWTSSASTRANSRIGIGVEPDSIRIWTSPSVEIDALWPWQNMRLGGATYNIRTGQVDVDVWRAGGLGSGFIDARGSVRTQIGDLLRGAIAGTDVTRRDYNPLSDPNIGQTLQRIMDNFQAMPRSEGADEVGLDDLEAPSVSGQLALRDGFHFAAEQGGVDIPAGGVFTVTVNGSGRLDQIAAADSVASGARAANIQSLSVQSEDITLLSGGDPIMQLKSLTVHRGGRVEVHQFELLGDAATAAGFESLLRLFGGILAYGSQGVPDRLAVELSARQASPDYVNSRADREVEQALSSAVRQLLEQHAHSIPGLDLNEIFGEQQVAGH